MMNHKPVNDLLNYTLVNGRVVETSIPIAWVGKATSKVVDKILICPKTDCKGIPTIRPGCASCGSSNIRPDLLVHHYACGNVDFLHNYVIDRQQGSLTCPKCHKTGLIINCDYDVSHGLQKCYDCGWTGNAAKLIGQCTVCETRFLVDEADTFDVVSYKLEEGS